MYRFARLGFWALFFKTFQCHKCGSQEGYVSRPRNVFERFGLPPLFMRPARCGDCYCRTWRPVTVPLHPRKEPMRFDPEEMVASAQAADQQETQKETQSSEEDHRRIA
jgi:hypothetical protein